MLASVVMVFGDKYKYRTDASITPPSSKVIPPSLEQFSKFAMNERLQKMNEHIQIMKQVLSSKL